MRAEKHTWSWVLLLLIGCTLTLSAQDKKQITLDLRGKTLPAALKLIEREGGKNIIFSYNETEAYRVNTVLTQKTQPEAIRLTLAGTPFVCKERDDYFVVQKEREGHRAVEIKGKIYNEKDEPLAYANVLLLARRDSAFVNGTVTRQDGSFVLLAEEGAAYTLKVSYVGYQTAIGECLAENRVRLQPDAREVREVVVTANRPLIEARGNGLLAHVSGTPLAKMGSAAEMIAHLPFVTGRDGAYTVLGHGSPVIYINNRKMRDQAELDRLRADEILSAEVITTPGVEYGSDVQSVIRIRTIRLRGQGLSGSFNATYSQGHSASFSENMALNYRVGGLDLFVKGYLSEANTYATTSATQRMDVSSQWYTEKSTVELGRGNKRFSGEVGFNYELDEHHSFGAHYQPNGNLGDRETESHGETSVRKDGVEADYVRFSQYNRVDPSLNHSVNGYYVGEFGGWNIDFNADYLFGRSNSWQEVVNNDVPAALSENHVRNYLYAARLVAKTRLGTGDLSFGTEETFTNRHDLFTQNGFSADADDHIKQSFYSLFADYSVRLGKFRLGAGLRYERQKTDYYERAIHQEEQSPVYNDWIPMISLGYSPEKWNFSLSYRLMKFNPTYSMLSSAISYKSKYEYSNGNPLLVPQKHNYVSLDVSRSWVYANIYFDKIIDVYTSFFTPYDDVAHPGVLLMTVASIPSTLMYGASAGISPKVKRWSPQLNVSIYFYDSDTRPLGIPQHWNEPSFRFKLDNSFDLPHGWFVNVSGELSTGARQSYAINRVAGRVDARVSKSFLKEDALTLAFKANDIFRTGYSLFDLYGDRIFMTNRRYYDQQRVGLEVSYKFNATKSKYKGTGAGQSEKGRF